MAAARAWIALNILLPAVWALAQLLRHIEPTTEGLMVSVATRGATFKAARADARWWLRRAEVAR